MTDHSSDDRTSAPGVKRIVWAVLAVIATACASYSQEREMTRGEPEERPPFLFYEPVNLIGKDSSLTRLDIPYRIDQSYFVPVKNSDRSSHWGFVSRGEILIELFDSLDVSRSRSIQSVEIGTDRPDREQPGQKWYKGIASFELPPGPYRIVFEVDDLESDRRYTDSKSTIRLRRFSGSRELSTPLFVRRSHDGDSANTLEPVDFGHDLLFGEKAAIYVEMPASGAYTGDLRAEYSISVVSSDHPAMVALAETVAAPRIYPHVDLTRVKVNNTAKYSISSNDSSHAWGIVVPLASEKLALRRFELSLTIRRGADTSGTTKSFQMVWPDMPFSLRDVDYAINALKYVTTDDQRDSLHRGTFEERRDKLEEFWREKNNNPGVAYNDMMVEYYRRVDHASRTFGTLHEPDGFKSDRGRIYILYGPPTTTDRTLSPTAGYQEVWTYERLGKKFIFSDQTKSGNYILIATQPL